jgi:hypothetical protein
MSKREPDGPLVMAKLQALWDGYADTDRAGAPQPPPRRNRVSENKVAHALLDAARAEFATLNLIHSFLQTGRTSAAATVVSSRRKQLETEFPELSPKEGP